MLTHSDLIRDIDKNIPEAGVCRLWWMGQMSFILRMSDTTIYIDPFLSELGSRQVPAMLKPEELTNADIIVGTHDHVDHIDRAVWPALAEASPKATFVVPAYHVERLSSDLEIPQDRFVGLNDGSAFEQGGVKMTALPSAHEFLDQDPDTGLYPFMGVQFSTEGISLYHSGDTCLYEGLQARLRALQPDIMILPINGRDAERLGRGCIGNMTYQEAADLAGPLKPSCVIPGHWDMFEGNLGDPKAFKAYYELKYSGISLIPEYGQCVRLTKRKHDIEGMTYV